jgi:hypothetical protein
MMKLTESQLRKIIREEMEELAGRMPGAQFGKEADEFIVQSLKKVFDSFKDAGARITPASSQDRGRGMLAYYCDWDSGNDPKIVSASLKEALAILKRDGWKKLDPARQADAKNVTTLAHPKILLGSIDIEKYRHQIFIIAYPSRPR